MVSRPVIARDREDAASVTDFFIDCLPAVLGRLAQTAGSSSDEGPSVLRYPEGVPWSGTIVPSGPGRRVHAEQAGADAELQVSPERGVEPGDLADQGAQPPLDVDARALGE